MSRTKRILFAVTGILAALVFSYTGQLQHADAATVSKAECVIETSSLRFLQEENADVRLPMASTTKILTALTIIEDCDLDTEVTVPKQAEGTEGSSVYLHAGDVYTVRELLYGLMLRSGNDCAVTLALHHSGDIQTFASVMNRKALWLGAEHSHFANPHGLPDPDHYTTARDLALISAHAMENETFREIVSCQYYAPRNWKNKNKMLFRYEGADGVKTGFTTVAGRCLVTSAKRNGMRVVCVVLSSPQMYERTEELLDSAFEKYSMTELCNQSEPCFGFRIGKTFRYPLTKEEQSRIALTTELISPLPDTTGSFAGILKISLKNSLLFSQNLYIMEE